MDDDERKFALDVMLNPEGKVGQLVRDEMLDEMMTEIDRKLVIDCSPGPACKCLWS